MGSFPLTKSSYLTFRGLKCCHFFLWLKILPWGERCIPCFVCWVSWTASLYLTDMGSMCACFPEFHKRNNTPSLELHVRANSKLGGKKTWGSRHESPLICGSECWGIWNLIVCIHLLEEVLRVWVCLDGISSMVRILRQGGELLTHKGIRLGYLTVPFLAEPMVLWSPWNKGWEKTSRLQLRGASLLPGRATLSPNFNSYISLFIDT